MSTYAAEIIGSPFTVYIAPLATAFPALEDEEADFDTDWFKLGTSGTKNYSDDGVTVTHDQSVNEFIPAGGTGPRKAFRVDEHLTIECSLADLSPAQYAKVLNDATLTTVAAGAGQSGEKHFSLQQGLVVARFALLARGISSVDDTLVAQYEVPVAYQSEAPAPKLTKGDAAMLAVKFTALEDPTDGFGVLRVQTAVPTA